MTTKLRQQGRGARVAKTALGYVCAVTAPIGAAAVSLHSPALHGTPMALNFAIVALLTLSFGMGVGLTASASTCMVFMYWILTPAWVVNVSALERMTVMLAVGLFITWMCNRQRENSTKLRAMLETQHEQQEALMRSEKLAAVGRLSATVAHEINNPLESVTNLLYLSALDPALSAETSGYLAEADRELRRLAGIARHTLTFVRPHPKSGPVEVSAAVRSVAGMFDTRFKAKNGELRVTAEKELWAELSPDDLRQVLTNLIGNACDALPAAGGMAEVRVLRGAGVVRIEVRDNGGGIAPEHVERIFEAFFTTKADVGTGIGLWVTKELVEKNGGRIGLERKLRDGWTTEFWVEVPYHAA